VLFAPATQTKAPQVAPEKTVNRVSYEAAPHNDAVMTPPVPVTEYHTPGEVTVTVHAGNPLSTEAPMVAPFVEDGMETARAVAHVSFGTQAI